MFLRRKKRKLWPIVLSIFLLAAIVGAILIYQYISNHSVKSILSSNLITQYTNDATGDFLKLVPQFLGFDESRTYLLLFQNNTELRPSGGFIGSYAVVQMDKGSMNLIRVEGTETIDRNTPKDWKPVPPQPITDHLGVDRWYFRDANWSPDFVASAAKALELYKGEEGIAAQDIDAVIAITPTVIERMLKHIGPVTVADITFTEKDITEKLEYEVEYGYREKGIPFERRKEILEPFMRTLLQKIKTKAFLDYDTFLSELVSLANEKHILVSSENKELQKLIDEKGWAGRIIETEDDYLLWVDANLAALKTDHAMERDLQYTMVRNDNGEYIVSAQMHYTHNGSFDWRTTRYLSYVRVFVPKGSKLISVHGIGKKNSTPTLDDVDIGHEGGKDWFGSFISIEPGQERDVTFVYKLPTDIQKRIEKGMYTFVVQKQAGTGAHGLTLDLDFDTTITSATPAEKEEKWGDTVYNIDSDLLLDRIFQVKLK